MVELRTVKHACERFGRRGEGLGCKAVVAGHSRSPTGGFWGLFTGAIYRRLLRETLVWQEVGLNSVLPSSRLGCGEDTETGQLPCLTQAQQLLGCDGTAVPSGAGFCSVTGGREGVTWGTGSYFFSTGLGFSTGSGLCQGDKSVTNQSQMKVKGCIQTGRTAEGPEPHLE